MPFGKDKMSVLVDVDLHSSQSSAVADFQKAVITDGGIGDSVRQHDVYDSAAPRKDGMLRLSSLTGMGKEFKPVPFQVPQFGPRNTGAPFNSARLTESKEKSSPLFAFISSSASQIRVSSAGTFIFFI